MDISALNLRSVGGFPLGTTRKGGSVVALRRGAVVGWRIFSGDDVDGGGSLVLTLSAKKRRRSSLAAPRHQSVVVRSIGNKKNPKDVSPSGEDPSIPEEDSTKQNNQDQDKAHSGSPSKKYHHDMSDWRNFRASLVAREQEQSLESDALTKDTISSAPLQRLGLKWAHPISAPETGCVLVATKKLDGLESFERTVVLLLRLGSRDPREGPFGVILNRPLQQKIKNIKPSNPHLSTTFADCSIFRGGPLDANVFILDAGDNAPFPGFEKVMSGVCYGARNSLGEAAALVNRGVLKAQDLRFFVGYAGWQFDQLLDEIESEYWIVAACSSHLINGPSSESANLWEEILQLMGGQYSELSRKPRQGNNP